MWATRTSRTRLHRLQPHLLEQPGLPDLRTPSLCKVQRPMRLCAVRGVPEAVSATEQHLRLWAGRGLVVGRKRLHMLPQTLLL